MLAIKKHFYTRIYSHPILWHYMSLNYSRISIADIFGVCSWLFMPDTWVVDMDVAHFPGELQSNSLWVYLSQHGCFLSQQMSGKRIKIRFCWVEVFYSHTWLAKHDDKNTYTFRLNIPICIKYVPPRNCK